MVRIKALNKLTLSDMIYNPGEYTGLSDGLIKLPLPEKVKIGRKRYTIPKDLSELSSVICYGQRMFLAREESNDFGSIVRIMDGYYYPIVTGNKWDEDKALLFGRKILICTAEELYPVTMYIAGLVKELVEREYTLLNREPSKIELAAGIEKLNRFTDMSSLDYLRDSMKITIPEVILTPYNEILVRFMMAKENQEFQERYLELMKEQSKPKPKYKEA